MNWGTIIASTMACVLAILLLFSCSQYNILNSEYMSLYNRHHDLKSKYKGLQEDYQKAVSKLKIISEENAGLRENYTRLVESYEKLRLQYDDVESRYEDLKEKYGNLVSKYSEINASLLKIEKGLEEISDRILTPSDRIPHMLKQASPTMVEDIVYRELELRAETPPEIKAKKVLEWIMLNLQYSDDDFHQYLIDNRLESYQDFLSLPNETLVRGGGDCEDLATLVYTMLKAVLKKGEQIYIVQITGRGVRHVGVIYELEDKLMILDPAGGYVTDAKISLEMSMKKGLKTYKIWLNPLAIRREGKKFLMENGFAKLIYMKPSSIEEGEAYKFLKVDDAVTLWLNHWRKEMIHPSIGMVANDTFVKVFNSTQEFLDWMEKS